MLIFKVQQLISRHSQLSYPLTVYLPWVHTELQPDSHFLPLPSGCEKTIILKGSSSFLSQSWSYRNWTFLPLIRSGEYQLQTPTETTLYMLKSALKISEIDNLILDLAWGKLKKSRNTSCLSLWFLTFLKTLRQGHGNKITDYKVHFSPVQWKRFTHLLANRSKL